ncbi:MAG: GIY-YIG nuclease family protein, partial [Candidatus Acidiferrales bacterium]
MDRVRLRRKPEGREFLLGAAVSHARQASPMYFVYVLRSCTTDRHYVGYTSDLVQRLGQHNSGITKSTKNRGP